MFAFVRLKDFRIGLQMNLNFGETELWIIGSGQHDFGQRIKLAIYENFIKLKHLLK